MKIKTIQTYIYKKIKIIKMTNAHNKINKTEIKK